MCTYLCIYTFHEFDFAVTLVKSKEKNEVLRANLSGVQ